MRIQCTVGASLLTIASLTSSLRAQADPSLLVYSLNIPNGAAYDSNSVGYGTDNHTSIADNSFTRVAYQLTLGGSTNTNSPNGTVYVSFDTFTNTASRIGVPNFAPYDAPIQQLLTNMNVVSTVPGVTTETGITTGNIEFWNSNYDPANSLPVPGASGGTFDFGDRTDAGSYGSMQIHNYGASQTIFAYDNWGGNAGGTSDLGIGNSPTGDNPDWTFRGNASDYTVKTLEVFVNPEPTSLSLMALGFAGLMARRRRV